MDILPFDDVNERLFLRIKEEQLADGAVIPGAVRLPDWSTNRERFSRPDDVLNPDKYPGYTRVGEVVVGSIPSDIPPDVPATGQQAPDPWECYAQHDPLDENYAHSEVRVRKVGCEFDRTKRPSSSAYVKKIRNQLAGLISVRPLASPEVA